MAILGKRKAPEPPVGDLDANEIFRRHFEAQFAPLAPVKNNRRREEDQDDVADDDFKRDEGQQDGQDSENSEWSGLSAAEETDGGDDDGEANTIEVVDYSSPQMRKPTAMSKRELKAFMSSRPPSQTTVTSEEPDTTSKSKSSSKSLPEDAPSLLAQDLELRRLLAESHLLAPKKTTSVSANANLALQQPKSFASGRTRQKATDLRVQALGSKVSIHKQEKMPMSMRKGMVAAAGARESKRRREAKENGIILERETGKGKRRDRAGGGGGGGRAVDRPGVGRFKGAELRISEHDVKRIEGSRDTFGRGGRGKRR